MMNDRVGIGTGKIKLSAFFELLAIFYLAHKLLPVVGHYTPSVIYAGIIAILLFILFLYSRRILVKRELAFILGAFAVSALDFILRIQRGSGLGSLQYVYGEIQLVLYALICFWLLNCADLKSAKRFLFILFLFYIVTALTTYIGCVRFPQAARYLATYNSSIAEYQLYVSNNIGSFTFVYELVLISPLIIYMLKAGKINKFIGAAILALFGMTILATEYTGALIFFAISLLLIPIKNLSSKKIWALLLVFLFVIFVGNLLLANFFEMLSQNVESELISDRLQFLSYFLRGEFDSEVSASGGSRMDFYQKSWSAFLNSSMFGTWVPSTVGGHSYVLDTIGKYGILGVVALFLVYRGIYKFCLRPNRNENFYPYLLWIYVVTIAVAIINPKPNLFIFLCIIPLFTYVMQKNNA